MTDTLGSPSWRTKRLELLAKFRAVVDDESATEAEKVTARRKANRILDQLAVLDGPRPAPAFRVR